MGLDCVMERESSSESPLSPSLYSENDDGAAERVPLGSCFGGKSYHRPAPKYRRHRQVRGEVCCVCSNALGGGVTDGGVTLCTPRTLSTMFTMFTMSFFPLCTTISLVHGSGLARQHIAATLAVYEHLVSRRRAATKIFFRMPMPTATAMSKVQGVQD